MKYRVKLKTTVTAWQEVQLDEDAYDFGEFGTDAEMMRENAADDAVARPTALQDVLRELPDGFEYGPIELAHEELGESVQVIA